MFRIEVEGCLGELEGSPSLALVLDKTEHERRSEVVGSYGPSQLEQV